MDLTIKCLDEIGYVTLLNIAGPTRRPEKLFDADDVDPAEVARISFNDRDLERTREDDLKLAEYLMKNLHTTPIEMIECWFEMKMPIFIARQLVRHRTVSINEMSGRYVQLPPEFYIPDPKLVGAKSKSNKQGRTIEYVERASLESRQYVSELTKHCELSYARYDNAIKSGVPNELARCFLPLNVYTKWVWKQDLHNLMHMMALRLHSHAQYEVQSYPQAVYDLLLPHLPKLMEVFDKYRRKKE